MGQSFSGEKRMRALEQISKTHACERTLELNPTRNHNSSKMPSLFLYVTYPLQPPE